MIVPQRLVALALFLASVVAPALAQQAPSDGSLENAYASQCPNHEDNELCRMLRASMHKAATVESVPAPKVALGLAVSELPAVWQQTLSEQFGLPAGQGVRVDTVFQGGTAAVAGIWKDDVLLSINGTPITRERPPTTIIAEGAVGQPVTIGIWRSGYRQQIKAKFRAPVPAVADPAAVPPPLKVNGDATDPRVTAAGVGAIDALARFLHGIWLEEPVDGHLRQYFRFVWDGVSRQLTVQRATAGASLGRPDEYRLTYSPSDNALHGKLIEGGTSSAKRDVTWRMTSPRLFVSDIYSIYSKKNRQRDGVGVAGADRIVTYHSQGQAELNQLGIFVRVPAGDPDGVLARAWGSGRSWLDGWRAEQQAKKEQNSSSGLLGALAMATGAALAGGNAEHVMGAAMKGAELSTDNQMTRNVLAGQGDQMIAAGTQRMNEESAQRSGSSSSGAQGAGPASRTASMSPPPPLSGALGQAPRAGSGPPIRFYYVVSLVPTANDTRNPLCVSNVVTLDARLDADPWGRRAKAAPLVEAYRDRFVAECSRLGRITSLGNLYYTIEGVDSGWPYPSFHPADQKVMLP